MNDTQVIIVGAGPVGLTLSLALADLGVHCILIEKNDAPSGLPKMERCNARTMEIYRRLGIGDDIRAAGLPEDCPMDVFVVTRLVDEPILRLPYGSVKQCKEDIASHNDGTRTLEPYQLISQYTLEPLLKQFAEQSEYIDVRFGHEFIHFDDNGDHVSVNIKRSDGTESIITGDYLVGCDGGASPVRKQMGIKLNGDGDMLSMHQALFRCDDLYERIPIGKGRHYHVCDEKSGFVIVQDDTKHFTFHAVVDDESDMPKRFEEVVGMPIEYETLYIGKWTQRLLVADKYGEGKVFIAGDAAHLVIPTGGLGMNTGVGDVIDLAWKLQGTLQGWGGEQLLNSYLTERRQIGVRNVAASGRANSGRYRWRSEFKPQIRDRTPEGAEIRSKVAEIANVEQRKTNEILGIEAGYRYVESPLIWQEPEQGPDPDRQDYVPTTWPGFRLPHVWLKDGTAIQDNIGKGYTLLRFDNDEIDMSGLISEFENTGAPLEVLSFDDSHAVEVYEGYKLFLLRPDLHIIWRGTEPPESLALLREIATGLNK
jgi:2-polyprenyl-6-methoxyphenol hydroxylase-like FAD-dependent oxidoreductase